jgi:hypothetical protein
MNSGAGQAKQTLYQSPLRGSGTGQAQPLVITLGTSWIKGYEKGRYLQYDALNPLIGNIRSYCESKGIPFIIDDDDKLPARINAERAKEGKQGAKVYEVRKFA